MPEITTGKAKKKRPDGTVLEYEYYRSTWTDTEGKRHYATLGNTDVVTAADAHKKLLEIIAGKQKPSAKSITVKEWCETQIGDMDAEQSTVNQYRAATRQAIECWGEHKRLRDVKTADVDRLVRYIRENPMRGEGTVSDWTIRNRCVSLSAMFERATVLPSRDRPYIHHNPFEDAKVPSPTDIPEYVHVSVDQAMRLIEAAPDNNIRALVALTRLMALRLEEALFVAPEHINWQLHATVVQKRENRRGKGRSTKQEKRMVPMSKAAYRVILDRFEELPEGFSGRLVDPAPLTKGAQGKAQKYMRRLQESVGILNLRHPFHDMRASQAQDWSILHGVENSARWCGHSIEVALKHYRANASEALGLVTGLADPKAKLAAEYTQLDEHVAGATS